MCLVTQSYPTLCDPVHCSPPGSSVHGDSPAKNTGVGCHAFLQGIFPTQGLKPDLPHCGRILNHLSYQWSPRILKRVAYPFSRRFFQPRNWTRVSYKWILYQLSYQGSPLWRKAMTNLDSILKNKDISLPTKIHIVKPMVFPVVIYGCENWTIKTFGCQRIDAFILF